jgi:hypothetical protein
MKNFEILLNNRYTATTQTINSGLEMQNDYYVYINKNGGGIVNQYNVRGYLNDPRNQQITNDFIAYLTGSTTQDQTLNILTADKKLADTFNDYYQRVIISATSITSTAVINENLTGTTQIVAYTYDHPWSGYAPSKQLTGITQDIYGSINNTQSKSYIQEFTTEESYYIPVCLERGTNQLARYQYDLCNVFISAKTAGFFPRFSGITSSYFGSQNIPNIVGDADSISLSFLSNINTVASTADTRIHTLLDCFVDLNLETNEITGAPDPLLKVSFEFPNYIVNEGDIFQVKVKLDSPSVLGIEEASIDLITPTITPATISVDYLSGETYPVTFSWSAGEQNKFLNFTAKTDFYLESTENYLLQISNIVNLDPGTFINASVGIADTTILRSASLSIAPPAFATSLFAGAQSTALREGETIDLAINLDGPAFGVEAITLSLVSAATVVGGTIGPLTNLPVQNVDYKISATSYTFTFAPGETQKTFRFSALTDITIENAESLIFELQNPQFCLIDSNFKVMTVDILDTTGGYKYVHLNFGNIYSEWGNGQTTILMRQLNPQPPTFGGGGYQPIYSYQYAHNLIQYGTTIKWRDYTGSAQVNTDYYNASLVKAKITNLGSIQSIVNGVPVNTGQTITLGLSGNNYIITATTNSDKNATTDLFDYANYKIEIINNYSGVTIPLNYALDPQPIKFKLRTTGNTLSTNNTLLLGNYSLSGMTTLVNNTTNQYRLQSKYKNVNTGRVNTGSYSIPVWSCPPVSSFSTSVSYTEFYSINLENISVLGIIFLNYNTASNYTNNSMSSYDSFDFIRADAPYTITCAQTNSEYNDLNYISLPFHLEP